MQYIDLVQGSESWKSWRMAHLGGSDAASIMGIGFMTPYQLYLNKLGLYEPEVSNAMRRGSEMEAEARARFIEDKGQNVLPVCVESEKYPFLAASLDGISEDGTFMVEIKTGSRANWELALQDKVPDAYYCQIQHCLNVTGLDLCYYMFYHDREAKYIPVYRNTKYIETLLEAEKKFWKDLVNFVPPALTDKDYVLKTDDEWVELAHDMIGVQEQIKLLEKREKELREKLIELAGDNSCKCGGLKVSKIPRRGTIDYTAIPQLKGLDLEPYRKPTTITWRITT